MIGDDHQPRQGGRSGGSAVQRGPLVTLTKEEKQALVDSLSEEQLANPHLRSVYEKCLRSLLPIYDTMRKPLK